MHINRRVHEQRKKGEQNKTTTTTTLGAKCLEMTTNLVCVLLLDPNADGLCGEGYMKCEVSQHCISYTLRCNGYQNCGQNDNTDSDSADCKSKHKDNSGVLSIYLYSTYNIIVFVLFCFFLRGE